MSGEFDQIHGNIFESEETKKKLSPPQMMHSVFDFQKEKV